MLPPQQTAVRSTNRGRKKMEVRIRFSDGLCNGPPRHYSLFVTCGRCLLPPYILLHSPHSLCPILYYHKYSANEYTMEGQPVGIKLHYGIVMCFFGSSSSPLPPFFIYFLILMASFSIRGQSHNITFWWCSHAPLFHLNFWLTILYHITSITTLTST